MTRPGSLKVAETFAKASVPAGEACSALDKKRASPFSIRFSDAERNRLDVDAGDMPLGAYIKSRLFGPGVAPVRRTRRPSVDRMMLSGLLGKLGASRLPQNMNQIAKAANLGTLPVMPETEAEIRQACYDIAVMRLTLMKALGKSSGSGS